VKTLVEHTPKDHFSYQPLLHMILEANKIKVQVSLKFKKGADKTFLKFA